MTITTTSFKAVTTATTMATTNTQTTRLVRTETRTPTVWTAAHAQPRRRWRRLRRSSLPRVSVPTPPPTPNTPNTHSNSGAALQLINQSAPHSCLMVGSLQGWTGSVFCKTEAYPTVEAYPTDCVPGMVVVWWMEALLMAEQGTSVMDTTLCRVWVWVDVCTLVAVGMVPLPPIGAVLLHQVTCIIPH